MLTGRIVGGEVLTSLTGFLLNCCFEGVIIDGCSLLPFDEVFISIPLCSEIDVAIVGLVHRRRDAIEMILYLCRLSKSITARCRVLCALLKVVLAVFAVCCH